MERGAHTHIYTSTLSRRERAWRGRRRYWLRFLWTAGTVIVVLGVALNGLVVHLV
jgi:hypothetical protein